MHNEILPAATDLYRDAASQLRDHYEAGTSTLTLVLVLVAGLGMLALLVVVQIFVRRRSNRLLNLGLVAARPCSSSACSAGRSSASRAPTTRSNRAQERGSDSVEVLSSARILTLRAQNNENLALIERGTGDVYVAEFDRLMGQLGGTDGKAGLLGYAAKIADRTGDGSRESGRWHRSSPRCASSTRRCAGTRTTAVTTTRPSRSRSGRATRRSRGARTGRAPDRSSPPSTSSRHALQHDIARSQVRLASAAQDARNGFGVLEVAIPLFAVLAGLLVLLGLERRIGEYR